MVFISALFISLVLAIAIGVIVVVAVGVGGKCTKKHQKFTAFAAQATKHLNGEAEPPHKLVEIVKR